MYYLWKDKKDIFYITDFKEIRNKDGKVKIDVQGYLEVELILSSMFKTDLLSYVQKTTFTKE
jgi:hypothetical protein